MIHIQKSNEGIDIPKRDFISINISTNLYFNGKGIKRYVNKVYMKIKPSDNALCEDERIDREDCMYNLKNLKILHQLLLTAKLIKFLGKTVKRNTT